MGRAASCAWLAVILCGPLAFAQDKEAQPPPTAGEEPTPPASKEPEPAAAEPPAAEPPAATPEAPSAEPPKEAREPVTPSEQAAQAGPTAGWQDIVVVPRRPVLKRRRVEFAPTYNVSINNPLVRHHGFGGQLNFYLSEAFFLGLEGTYYVREPFSPYGRYFLIGLDQRVQPSVNQYVWSAFLDFGYIPIHGKFTLFNTAILHWDTWISAGVGMFQSQVIPRNPADSTFSNLLIGGLLPGFGARLWVNRWFAIEAYFKDYIFVDQLEPKVRSANDCQAGPSFSQDAAKCKTDSQFTFNVVFGLGVSIFLPTGFEYKTLR